MKQIENKAAFLSYMENTKVESAGSRHDYVSWLKTLLNYGFDINLNLDEDKIKHIVESLKSTEDGRVNHKSDKYYTTFTSVLRKYKAFLVSEESINNVLMTCDDANSGKIIQELEAKMRDLTPEAKQRISKFIERGTIAKKVKKLMGYKCLVCEALKNETLSFQKDNGELYIETHHVEPVSNLKKGALGLSNLLTLCANHHRQMHYGKVKRIDKDENDYFLFKIDGKEIKINKINIENLMKQNSKKKNTEKC